MGTDSYLDNNMMRTQLEAKMDSLLWQLYKSKKLSSEKDFQKWLKAIRIVNNTHHFAEKRQWEIADEAVWAAKKPLLSSSKHNFLNSRLNGATATSNASNTPKLPALTVKKCKLLAANEGCFKCHILFAGHLSRDCKNGFPDVSNYRTVSQATVDAHRVLHAHASKLTSTMKTLSSMAAVAPTTSASNWMVNTTVLIETIAAVYDAQIELGTVWTITSTAIQPI